MIDALPEPTEPTAFDLFPPRDDMDVQILTFDVATLTGLIRSYSAMIERMIDGRIHPETIATLVRRLVRIANVLRFRLAEDNDVLY